MKYIVFDISGSSKQCANELYKLQTPSYDDTQTTKYCNTMYQSGTWDNTDPDNPIFTPDGLYEAIAFDEVTPIPLRTTKPDGTEWGNGFKHAKDWIDYRFPNIEQSLYDNMFEWIINTEETLTETLLLPTGYPDLPSFMSIQTQQEFDQLEWDTM